MKEILLTQGKVALVDDEDFDRVNIFNWCASRPNNIWYAVRKLPGLRKTQSLHQFLMPDAKQIDHADGDGLNNQKANIRVATQSQNAANIQKRAGGISRFKGVYWHKRDRLWGAQIKVAQHRMGLGFYKSEIDAAISYDAAAKAYFGEFASVNFPP